jgi:hypothetical protein
MSSVPTISLADQRRALVVNLHAQRVVIAAQLNPQNESASGYPRSKTMRFLTQHSALAGSVVAGATTVLVGTRYFKPIAAALTMMKLVRSATSGR